MLVSHSQIISHGLLQLLFIIFQMCILHVYPGQKITEGNITVGPGQSPFDIGYLDIQIVGKGYIYKCLQINGFIRRDKPFTLLSEVPVKFPDVPASHANKIRGTS